MPTQTRQPRLPPETYRVRVLPGGLTLALAPLPHMASVSLGFWVGVGGRHEPAHQTGISHFLEHLLFKGTRRRSALQLSQAIEGLGGYVNAFTSEEHTCFYAKAGRDHFPVLLDVLGDMYLNSTFAPPEIEKERDVIKEEIAMYLDQPHLHVQELLNATLWPNHPLGRPLTGTPESIDTFTRADLHAYRRTHYGAGNTLIAVAGNLSAHRVQRAVEQLARQFGPGQPPPFKPAVPRQQHPVVRLQTKATEQTQLALGIRTCPRHDERRFALRLLNIILGENTSSRLFQALREETALAYSVSSALSFFADTGDLVISAGLETDHLPQALGLIRQELARLAQRPPSAAEFRRARDYAIGQLDLSLENSENQMMWLGEQWLGYQRLFPPHTIRRQLGAVAPAEIHRAARDFFRPERCNLALVSPLKSTRGLARLLAA